MQLMARLPHLEERIKKYVDMVNNQKTLLLRFRGVGKLSKEEALKYRRSWTDGTGKRCGL